MSEGLRRQDSDLSSIFNLFNQDDESKRDDSILESIKQAIEKIVAKDDDCYIKNVYNSNKSTEIIRFSKRSEEPVHSNMDITTGHIVLSYMEDHLKNKEKVDEEWEALCSYVAEPNSCSVAMEHSRNNRFADILPYNHSRVVLNASSNMSGIDYINASCITDHDPRNPAYIATQGPLAHTVADFWQMVWEQGAVSVNNCVHYSKFT